MSHNDGTHTSQVSLRVLGRCGKANIYLTHFVVRNVKDRRSSPVISGIKGSSGPCMREEGLQ
jgi:hypothetical protein